MHERGVFKNGTKGETRWISTFIFHKAFLRVVVTALVRSIGMDMGMVSWMEKRIVVSFFLFVFDCAAFTFLAQVEKWIKDWGD